MACQRLTPKHFSLKLLEMKQIQKKKKGAKWQNM